jgi:hypothetical protein
VQQGHLKDSVFSCIFPGNKILDYFNHRKELSNIYQCEIDINEPLHLDLKNTRFSFSAVIGREDVQEGVFNAVHSFKISVEFINDIGQHIHSNPSPWYNSLLSSNHVWLNLNVVPCHSQQRMRNAVPQYSQVITNNLRVIFRIEDPFHKSRFLNVFFKSCGFHLKNRHEKEAIIDDDDDDGNLKSNWYPQQKRHSSSFPSYTMFVADLFTYEFRLVCVIFIFLVVRDKVPS